jgi:hypothetical protein
MADDDAPATQRKQTAGLIAAVILALAGNAEWVKPRDDSATKAAYEVTRDAHRAYAESVAREMTALSYDVANLSKRQDRFERWTARVVAAALGKGVGPESVPSKLVLPIPPPKPPPKPEQRVPEPAPALPDFGQLQKAK